MRFLTGRSLAWLGLFLFGLIVILAMLSIVWRSPAVPQSASTAPSLSRTPPPPPPLTPDRTVKAIGAKQFSLLVSYTDQGFEPKQASIHTGDTVRFTNNSHSTMSLSLKGAPQNLPPGEYWEYTFKSAGDTTITESTHNMSVVIHVR